MPYYNHNIILREGTNVEKDIHTASIAKNIISDFNKTGHYRHDGSYEKSDAFFSCREQGDLILKKLKEQGITITSFTSSRLETNVCGHTVMIDKTKEVKKY